MTLPILLTITLCFLFSTFSDIAIISHVDRECIKRS